jgi:hypothetical protein
MKKFFLFVMLYTAGYGLAVGQAEKYNLEKYWRYKDRFLNEFIVLPNGNQTSAGMSIPAMEIQLDASGNKTFINYTDGNANLSHYLSVLATEYKLVKNDGSNYDKVIEELYYALSAIDRIDQNSESFFRSDGSVVASDKNGWMIRDDVTPQFWINYSARLGIPGGDPAKFVSGYHADGTYDRESFSQDNVFHLLEGLALVNKLVSSEYVDVAGRSVDFAAWAKDITTRVIKMMQHSSQNIYLLNVKDKPFECVFSPPKKWLWIVDPAWATLSQTTYEICCNGFKTGWYIQNPVTKELAAEGSGVDFDTWGFFSYGLVRAGNKITGLDYNFDRSSGVLQQQLFTSWFNGELTGTLDEIGGVISTPVLNFITSNLTGLPVPLPDGVKQDLIKALGSPIVQKDPYKVKTLATIGNVFGEDTFWKLRTTEKNRYSQFMLMYLLLHGAPSDYTTTSAEYISDKSFFADLLFKAPCTGPRNYRTSSTDDYNVEWSASSRLVWPERNGVTVDSDGIHRDKKYNGLDYMLLHNLYCLAYQAPFKKLSVKITDDLANKSKTEKAVEVIASNKITGTSVVTYTASKVVKLVTGFSAAQGTSFTAKNVTATAYDAFSQYNQCIPHVSSSRVAENSEAISSNEKTTAYLAVVPNPNRGAFEIILSVAIPESGTRQITVRDITGKVVLVDQFEGKQKSIDLSHTNGSGIYIVSVKSGGKVYQGKLIIE